MASNGNDSDDLQEQREIIVDPKQNPLRIDKFLMDRLEKVTRNRVQNAIRAGAITVDEQEVKPNYKVKPGDRIQVVVPKPPGEGVELLPEDIPLDIMYEDNDLLIVNKPAGMVVHPGIGNYTGTLVNALAYHYQNLPIMPGNYPDRPGLVHRIDKNTSGLLVVAKNEYSMTRLAKQFYYHTIERRYQAIVWGDFEEDEGSVRGHVGRDPKERRRMTVFPEGEDGKWAVTHYRVLEHFYYVSLVECQLETGRTHQIRVHMKHLGHPLFSDERYGGHHIVKGTRHRRYEQFVMKVFGIIPRQALHAKVLGFEHPTTGETMRFESELPDDMQQCLEQWRYYVRHRKEILKKG